MEGLWDAFPVLHVAGTNAKGSLCAYTHQVLMDCGYKVGRFISPHLYRETERIIVNSCPFGVARPETRDEERPEVVL